MNDTLLLLGWGGVVFLCGYFLGFRSGRIFGAVMALTMVCREFRQQRATPAGLAASANDTAPSPPDCEPRRG